MNMSVTEIMFNAKLQPYPAACFRVAQSLRRGIGLPTAGGVLRTCTRPQTVSACMYAY